MILDIIDDALPHYAQESIKNILLLPDFPWYYSDRVASIEDTKDFYFSHHFYRNENLLHEIDGMADIHDIYKEIRVISI